MSAATLTTPSAHADWSVPPSGAPGVPFRRLMQAELRKLVDTRAGRGLLIAIAAVTILGFVIVLATSDPEWLTFSELVTGASSIQMMILPALGVIAVTSEWNQRSAMTTYTQEPRRGRVSVAKMLSAFIVTLVCTAALFVLGAAAHLAAIGFDLAPADWSVDGFEMFTLVFMQLLVVAQGVAFGMLFLSTPLALVVYYVLPQVLTLVLQLVSWLRDIAGWIDLNIATGVLYGGDPVSGEQWAKIAVTVTIWVVVPYLVGHFRITRREVK
ncbi:hypothetical protein ATL41_1726 [Flavimobilis soli]|uniref:ABC-2 family transporter n=1 Tax=Flavimobilis soli TaxID=442709 RepID=A0A2A9EFE1_9MICO|nr:hypothetical protein [Flavimobilis soli]PFG36982.1 hypothetical protein ATL41_1726 [Flavimobilis soli]